MASSDARGLRDLPIARPAYAFLFVLGVCLFACATVVTRWTSTESAFLGVGGLIPVSDAMGYFRCALSAADPALLSSMGVSADWCGRRILYPLSLLTMFSVGARSPALVLLLQASIIGACIGVSMIATNRALTRTTGLVAGLMCATFAFQWATANFMTEFLGLAAGLVAASLLLMHAVERNPAMAVTGIAMLSLGLAARSGAVFALPLVCIWCYLTIRPANQALHFPSLLLIAVAALLGPVLQTIGAAQIGANLANFGGNFSTSLYGLSTGSRNWNEAYNVFGHQFQTLQEGEVSRIIYSKALENIRAQPQVFLGSLHDAAQFYVRDLFGVASARLNKALIVLLVVGVLRCLVGWRTAAMSLTLTVFLGELLAAPLIIDSGGHRVFAATVWCRALLVGIGAATLIALGAKFLGSTALSKGRKASGDSRIAALALAGLLMALVIAPMTPLAGLMSLRYVESRHVCPTAQTAAIVNFEAESVAIGVGDRIKLPLWDSLIVAPGRFEDDELLHKNWWGQRLGPMPPGSWVAVAFDRQVESKGRLLPLHWQGTMPSSSTGLYAICVGDVLKGNQLGDFELRRLESIEAHTGR